MSEQAVIPGWVRPGRQEVSDFHRLAYAYVQRNPENSLVAGQLAAIEWVTCAGTGPVTGAAGQVTEDLAGAEMTAASEKRRTPDDEGRRAGGAADALAWLVGLLSAPPLTIPRRNPDGSVFSAGQLVAEEQAKVSRRWEPEERQAAEHRARAAERRWEALANLAASV